MWDSIIYNIYSMSDGAPVQVLYGWERNRYYLCENVLIANEGSSVKALLSGICYIGWNERCE